ncbi:MAG: SAM-dependent methyltransferase, partial [Calditrichia bacterium]
MAIVSNQSGIHSDLAGVVEKHLRSNFRKPVQTFNRQAFELAMEQADQHGGRLIFDSCCGVGESTVKLAEMFPGSFVMGMDKSAVRIDSSKYYTRLSGSGSGNFIIFRADVIDFWRLAVEAQIKLTRHFLLYPNPWPKKKRLTHRWYAHPVFPALLKLGGILIVRSNWKLYLKE